MIRIEHIPDPNNQFDNTSVVFEINEISLPEIKQQFNYFLMACGYVIQGLEEGYGEEEG